MSSITARSSYLITSAVALVVAAYFAFAIMPILRHSILLHYTIVRHTR